MNFTIGTDIGHKSASDHILLPNMIANMETIYTWKQYIAKECYVTLFTSQN